MQYQSKHLLRKAGRRPLNPSEKARIAAAPLCDRAHLTKRIRSDRRMAAAANYCKAKLLKMGLWNTKAARTGKVLTYRSSDAPPLPYAPALTGTHQH